MRRAIYLSFVLAFAAIGLARPAAAAPQILGLVAYNEPVPMKCEWGQCSAELITLCLQKHRDNPLAGTVYRFHDRGEAEGQANASLMVTDAKGQQRTLPAGEHVRISVARGFTAVRVEITERKLRELGGVSVAIAVEPGMSLLPEPKPDDPSPITKQEVEYTTAFLRVEADRWLRGTGANTVAARIVNRIINDAPRSGRVSKANWQSLWDEGVSREGGEARAEGRTRAKDIFGACRYMVGELGRFFSMRRCLEAKHDSLMLDMNTDFWRATAPGS